MGKTEKSQKENHATKVTKIPKIKRRKYGMNETLVSVLGVEMHLSICNLGLNKIAPKQEILH